MAHRDEMHLQRRAHYRSILVVIAVTAALIISIIFSVSVNNGRAYLPIDDSYYSSPSYDSERSEYHQSERPIRMLTADNIVHKSYIKTFRALSLEETCSLDVDGKTCIESLLAEAMNSTTKSFPWWFITLLRDIPQHTYKFWHNLTIMEPSMDFCTIEKIATTEVRNFEKISSISLYIEVILILK